VKSMPLGILRWMVIVVVLYAALMMLRSAAHGRQHPPSLEADRAAAI